MLSHYLCVGEIWYGMDVGKDISWECLRDSWGVLRRFEENGGWFEKDVRNQ